MTASLLLRHESPAGRATGLQHHTSKLRQFSDLTAVATFGFRGQALASLAALAQLSVVTRHRVAAVGARLTFSRDGRLSACAPAPRQVRPFQQVVELAQHQCWFRACVVVMQSTVRAPPRHHALHAPAVDAGAVSDCPIVRRSAPRSLCASCSRHCPCGAASSAPRLAASSPRSSICSGDTRWPLPVSGERRPRHTVAPGPLPLPRKPASSPDS